MKKLTTAVGQVQHQVDAGNIGKRLRRTAIKHPVGAQALHVIQVAQGCRGNP
ncbi:hypothetical protein V8G57_16440 [Collimonas sp. H4R21]|uniref:Uncharacterized protein n=1 Tax=Collimonas rhizosphaerae TaxID=3126357 RepID=A0ABU9PYB6_9BURK